MQFKRGVGGNDVLEGDGFYVSFRADTASVFGPAARLFGGDDNGAGETALCKDRKFLILNGDFREEYAAAAPNGYDACLAIYKANKDIAKSVWSGK